MQHRGGGRRARLPFSLHYLPETDSSLEEHENLLHRTLSSVTVSGLQGNPGGEQQLLGVKIRIAVKLVPRLPVKEEP